MSVNFRGQKYSSLKKACRKNGELFVDLEFPANNKSLFFSKVDNDIEWKRPKELCKVPKLVVEGVTCDDLNEGELGNTWFVTACSCLALEPKIWQKVVPNHKEQEWSELETDYAGIFHFQFWRYGQWIDVVIDDLLPTKDNKLIFCHSKARNEFWSALLEKAYAKLYGDYETLTNGYTTDALVDFTGGVAEKFLPREMNLDNPETRLAFFKDLASAVENKSIVSALIPCSPSETGQEAKLGLVKGHGYGITDMKEIKVNKSVKAILGTETLQMVRLRNPWGTKEWTGPWSDDSTEWNSLSGKDRDKMGLHFRSEGEFWMTFNDLIAHFPNLDICHFVNTAFFSLKKTWNEAVMYGEWTVGPRGGEKDRSGGAEMEKTFLYNPQFIFEVNGEKDTIMVCLEQDDATLHRKTGAGHNQIGFHIMRVENNRRFRVHIPGRKVATSEFLVTRSVFKRVDLVKGRYVIIPSTLKPGVSGRFMLRMYSSSNSNARPLTADCPRTSCCVKPYVTATRLNIVKAEKLERPQKGTMDAYVVVKCEGETVKSLYRKDNLSPEWNFKVIFYQKKPSVPITVEIYNNNLMIDDFIAMATIEEQGTETPEVKEFDLYGKKKEKDVKKEGKLFVEITTDSDLTAL